MEGRKAEFARFFDRLIHRASRKDKTCMPPETCKPPAVPVDPAQLTIENLSGTLPSKNVRQQDTGHAASAQPCSSAVTGEGSTTDDASPDDLTNDFTVGRWYPFTFKMMLHKLYELEEWGEKVKDVLERSRKDFKPLSEVNWEKKISSADERPQGRAQFKLKQQEVGVRGSSVRGGRATAHGCSFGNLASERIRRRSRVTVAG